MAQDINFNVEANMLDIQAAITAIDDNHPLVARDILESIIDQHLEDQLLAEEKGIEDIGLEQDNADR